MKKLYALFAGILLFSIVVCVFDSYMDKQLVDNKDAVRNARTFERFMSHDANQLIMDENTLPIFGSSELVALGDYKKEASSFLNSDDMNIITMGAGYFQSLGHAIELGSMAESIKSKKVALFVSPQWFSEEGVTNDVFPQRFSENHLLNFLNNDKISKQSKEYVLQRTEALLDTSPVQKQRVEYYQKGYENKLSVYSLYKSIMGEFWDIKSKYAVYKQIPDMDTNVPRIDLKKLDFNQMLDLAEKQGEASCTNNDFGIYDEYWDTYVKDVYNKGEIKDKKQVFLESPEYQDLENFLNIANELDIEVLLVSIPVHEKWYTFQGQLCDEYYKKINGVAKNYDNVELIDMTQYAGEKYFLKDIMHLGWKGWTRVNEALYREFKK